MALKKMIGAILKDLRIINQDQLEQAILKQRQISQKKLLPERLKRISVLTEAKIAGAADSIPLLGEILLGMDVVTREQLDNALKKQEDMIQRYSTLESDSLCTVMDMAMLINSSLNLVEVLSLIMKSANKVTNSVASTLMLLEESADELVFSVPTGPMEDKLIDVRIKKGQGIAGWVAQNEQPLLIPDVTLDERFYNGIDIQTGFTTKSIIAVPLKAKTKVIGVLEVINKADGSRFTKEDVLLLTILASQAAMAIENARLYSELRDSLEEEKQLQNRLIESNKFLALGQLASGIAHDFNNVLSAIMGYTEIASMDIPEGHKAKKSLVQVLRAANRAKDVVNQILTFARKHELESSLVDFRTIVDEALQFLKASLPSTIEIATNFTHEPCIVMADATKIHQVILNLCTNAHHAMAEKGGSLTIGLEPLEISDKSMGQDSELKPGRYLKFSISDTGEGMDEQIMERIFEPYFTTRSKGMGTGLGLSVVQGIVTSHDGAIRVSSHPGTGSTFEVFLPRVDEQKVTAMDSLLDLPRGNEKIIFVDDEKILINLAKQMLERLGYQVTTFSDPVEALNVFKNDINSFDLLMTDMTMPGMTGADLASKILKLRPDIPIILCTGFSDHINAEKANKIGIRAFAMKPMMMNDIAGIIRKTLDGE